MQKSRRIKLNIKQLEELEIDAIVGARVEVVVKVVKRKWGKPKKMKA